MENNNLSTKYEETTFKDFLTKYKIIIPMIQRDYAQGRITEDAYRVRNRFLTAIKEHLICNENIEVMKLDFVYGEIRTNYSKTVAQKIDSISVIPLDGQQRLTTLFLLHWYASRNASDITHDDYEFLKNFSYEVRPSSRDFCTQLINFQPNSTGSISSQIKDQNWFQGEWKYDPTIISMLTMIDAIDEKFNDIKDLWKRLTGDKRYIIFYFLPLEENGLSDELYIKMNSRGKKLTSFEHFKAEYESLYERDSTDAIRISHKFDVEWPDMLFNYRDRLDNTIDKEWMRYFLYISHILCYKQSIKKTNDEFELIESVYKDNPHAADNRRYLENAFDCWYNLIQGGQTIDEFFASHLSNNEFQVGKVTTFKDQEEYRNTQNFFNACIKYYTPSSKTSYGFSYSDFLFLYGIITYLINQNNIPNDEFRIRLRILRNLIWNSNAGEIRSEADYMKDLLFETEQLIKTGKIVRPERHGFNSQQEKEEIYKTTELQLSDEQRRQMQKFEDHPLIYGYVSGLEYTNFDLVDTFWNIFASPESYIENHRAMIAIDDYLQWDNNRYYMANDRQATWSRMLHRSNRNGLKEKTMPTLIKLMKLVKNGSNVKEIYQDFCEKQQKQSTFTWRYYFAQYPNMLRGNDGELTCDDYNDYEWITLNKHQFNGQHWNPFLNVLNDEIKKRLEEKKISTTLIEIPNYGEPIKFLNPVASLDCKENQFTYFYDDQSEDWEIPQDNNGIDTVDRIQLGIEKICTKLSL